MNFSNYEPNAYYTPFFQQYLYSSSKPYKAEGMPVSGFSIEDILEQDNNRLLDKVVNTALSVAYRLNLYRASSEALVSKWNELSGQIGELSSAQVSYNPNLARRKSMLLKEQNMMELKMLENRHETWREMDYKVNQFLDGWHKRQELKQDRKILG